MQLAKRSPVIAPLILLASVLKPLDDTRMLGKLAATLAAAGGRVAVAGRAGGGASRLPGVEAYPLFEGSRLSVARLQAQRRYWRLLHQLRPALVIVHAPELLPLTLLWQRRGPGRQFIYDIQENYALNIATQAVYRGFTKRLLAAGLRRVEALAARRAAAVLLAEASYAAELPFLHQLPPQRVLVLENKYQPLPGEGLPTQARPRPVPGQVLQVLYSGTISALNGVREALALAEVLHQRWPGGAQLTIIGFCQRPELLAELQQAQVAGQPVRLVGGAQPVPHAAVVAAIQGSHLGLALYQPHRSTERCRPTKLFEYLAHGLPVVVPANPLWASLVQAHGAGLVQQPGERAAALAERLVAALGPGGAAFYPQGPATDVLWASEGKKLGPLLETILPGFTFAPTLP